MASPWGWAPWCVTLGPLFCRGDGRRGRNPSTRNVRQSRGHGRGVLCPHAYCYSSGTGECAGSCHHHAWNQKSKIRPNGAFLAASLSAGRYGLLVVGGRVNWSRISSRNRMRRQGVEDVKGKMPFVGQPPKQPRRKLSKAELREQAAAAFLAWRAGQTAKDK